VQAIQSDFTDLSFPAALVSLPEPELPGPEWARVAVTVGGICGSDLHLFAHNTGPSPSLAGIAAVPFVFGHEIGGVVESAGPGCQVPVGTRVAVDPILPCRPRGIDPPCAHCARGWPSSCLMLDSRVLTPGRSLGYTSGLGGGWAELVCAHASALHPVPDGVPDRALSLHEPVSIAAHGLMRAGRPRPGEPVLVVGGGIIGLAAVAAVRGLVPGCPVTVLCRHEHQAAAAEACGAAAVRSRDDGSHFEELARRCGARVVGPSTAPMLMAGFPYVVEAVGSPGAVTESLRAVAHRGTVLLLGAAGISEVDLTPVWYKEAALIGSIDHAHDGTGVDGGHSIDRALEFLAAGLLPHEVVVTHELPLTAYRDAVATALDKRASGAVKVVFRPGT
jgi:threonine dehydrogenase-like Zn-dependent dehydrogenase